MTEREERARCVRIVRAYLSPRRGIMLARHPHCVLEKIIDEIMAGTSPGSNTTADGPDNDDLWQM
jgi:hypothetical protein